MAEELMEDEQGSVSSALSRGWSITHLSVGEWG